MRHPTVIINLLAASLLSLPSLCFGTVELDCLKQTHRAGRAWSACASSFILETPIDDSRADHERYVGGGLIYSHVLSVPKSTWWQDPKLNVRFLYADQLGVEDNETNLANTLLSLSGLQRSLNRHLNFALGLRAILPTNQDDYRYADLRLGLEAIPSITYQPSSPSFHRSRWTGFAVISKYLHEYDTNEARYYNRDRSLSLGTELRVRISDEISAKLLAYQTRTQLTDGSESERDYGVQVRTKFHISDRLSFEWLWMQADQWLDSSSSSRSSINFGEAYKTRIGAIVNLSY